MDTVIPRTMEIPPVSKAVRCLLFTALLTLPASSQESSGVQIAWASDAFATNLMADGTTTFGGSALSIQFEIGAFKAGFDPAAHPQTEWAANWVTLQSAVYDPLEDQVIQTATLFSNDSPFTENTQAYIWGYNTKDASTGIAEWIVLAADDWKWPSVNANLPATFSISDVVSSSEMLMGSVNGSYGDVGYHMRLEAVAIPEPAAAALGGLALLTLLFRRRR